MAKLKTKRARPHVRAWPWLTVIIVVVVLRVTRLRPFSLNPFLLFADGASIYEPFPPNFGPHFLGQQFNLYQICFRYYGGDVSL